jgi:hypothetical protein
VLRIKTSGNLRTVRTMSEHIDALGHREFVLTKLCRSA